MSPRTPSPRTGSRLGAAAETVPKATRGRTAAAFTPLRVRGHGIEVPPELREYIAERLGMHIGKFAKDITSVGVRLRDVSGPKGATVLSCAISANVIGHGPTLVTATGRESKEAFDIAAGGITRTIARLADRKQSSRRR